jgi:pectate lyase
MKVAAVLFSCLALTSAFAFPQAEVPGQEKHSSSKFGSFDLVGYAKDNPIGKTTGGEKGEKVTVKDAAALIAAVNGTTPRTIYVEGRIDLPTRLRVGSNKSILGVGDSAEIRQSGISVVNATNVIIRNLAIRFIVNNDGITIQNSTRVWIDHNEFESEFSQELGPDYYDGQLDTVRGSDWITISWNYFHDHWKSNLIGNSDALRAVDFGKLHLTYHHNYWVCEIPLSRYTLQIC